MRRPAAAALLVTAALVAGAATAVVVRSPDASVQQPPAVEDVAPDEDRDPGDWSPNDAQWTEAREVVEGLSRAELAGQLIVARHSGSETSLELVRDLHLAGVLVNDVDLIAGEGDAVARIATFNAELAEAGRERGVPVLRPVDQEGGLVARVQEPLTRFGTFMGAGAAVAGDPDAGTLRVREAAAGSAAELRAVGYNAVFAPVADLSIGADQPGIGSRSAGSDPEVVADAVVATVQGHGDAGVLSAVKHFPGHNVTADSHRGLPVLDVPRETLERRDLLPFVASVEHGAPAVMTGHLDVTALDAGTAASLSRVVVTDLLRDDLGHEGLIISDALDMAAVAQSHPGGEATVRALAAGSDVALMPVDARVAHTAVVEALRTGRLPLEQARDSATRTVAWLLAQEATEPLPGEPGRANDAARDLALAGAVVVTGPCERLLPDDVVTPVGDPAVVARFTEAARRAGLEVGSGPRLAFVGTGQAEAAEIVVATDSPYPLARTQAPVRIAMHGSGAPAMEALVDVLVDEAQPGGRLSVEVPGLEARTC